MCFFSSSVNWKKAASLESFRQKAVQQANSHSGRENWIREKSNQIKDTKEKKSRHKDIHTKRVRRRRPTPQIDMPAGEKSGKQVEGERWHVKRSRGFGLHSSLHFLCGWGGRLVYQRVVELHFWATAEWGLWEEERPPVRRLRWKARP